MAAESFRAMTVCHAPSRLAAYGRFDPVNQAFPGSLRQITLKKLDVNYFCAVLTIY
jgi:hypothetical protein